MAKPSPITPTLRSSRLDLRPLTTADVAVARSMWIDPDMRRYLCDDKVVSVDQAREWLGTSERNFAERRFGLWLLEERASVATIGFAGAQLWGDGAPELMYGLLSPWWHQGLATEAASGVLDYLFETLGHPVVMAATDPPNVASVRVMERLGMTFEWRGEKDGLDTVVYRLSRERWRTQRSTPSLRS